MITIFRNFCQFSGKKLAFFSKTNAMIKIFHNLALFRVKNANFSQFFGENIFKIITSVPDLEIESSGPPPKPAGDRIVEDLVALTASRVFHHLAVRHPPVVQIQTLQEGIGVCQIFLFNTYQNGKKCTN
jgi:hypothetical protein